MSLGVLYIFPMMLGATVLRPWETAISAVFCAILRWRFDTPSAAADETLRSAFAIAGYLSAGLFVTAVVRNRQLMAESLQHLQVEQKLRHDAETQLQILVESSPAAIIIIDREGVVVAANRAADEVFAVGEGNSLRGANVAKYVPVLSDALHLQGTTDSFRTAVQCQGRRANGEIFLAHVWFSSHGEGNYHISAIIVDSSEEMRAREEQNLQQLLNYNRITAAALAHEVRNISVAIGILSTNLQEKIANPDEDCEGLIRLARGLEKLAVVTLSSHTVGTVGPISLASVLDNLRIIIEQEWNEMGGAIRWPPSAAVPDVLADETGLLQSLLNLTQNSQRAVREQQIKTLEITLEAQQRHLILRVKDSGPGVLKPQDLFRPFQTDSETTGLGLYISRALVRSFGGDLRFEPQASGCCFAIELQIGG